MVWSDATVGLINQPCALCVCNTRRVNVRLVVIDKRTALCEWYISRVFIHNSLHSTYTSTRHSDREATLLHSHTNTFTHRHSICTQRGSTEESRVRGVRACVRVSERDSCHQCSSQQHTKHTAAALQRAYRSEEEHILLC